MAFVRQTGTLTSKTLLIVLVRHPLATVVRALIIPIILTTFLAFSRNFFVPPAAFGIGSPHPIKSFANGLIAAGSAGRETVAFVNSNLNGGNIDRVIETLLPSVQQAGKTAVRLSRESELTTACRANLRGVSSCYGAVVFYASPDEGVGGKWNYSIRADGSLGGGRIDTGSLDNDGQVYMLPFQHAIDRAIVALNSSGTGSIPEDVQEMPFTSRTKEERDQRIRSAFQSAITNFMAVTFLISMIGVCYHMAGFMATERELGMSTLIEAMMPSKNRWIPQVARLLSYHIAFSAVYLPGWVISSLILGRGVFTNTNVGIVLIYHILCGLALSSMAILGGAFFRKAQLSGVTVTIVYLLLGIIAQTITAPKTGTVLVLSLLFAPCNFVYFLTYIARFQAQEMATSMVKVGPDSPWNLPGIVLWVFLIIQIIVYPILGAVIEQYLYGTGAAGRKIVMGASPETADAAVRLEGFTKVYAPGIIRRALGFLRRPRQPVVAVDGLTLTARRGQILALLGANGSGKSTTLDAIAGTNKITSGKITIDGTGGLGIAPQKNVLWDDVTVEEHIKIFSKLKAPSQKITRAEARALAVSVDLEKKVKAKSKTLSGGQKRKLQLAMMLSGGSSVCCVDEVSSGIDPLSRRKIWDILLAERGRRTIILTTHFLDEADLLADHIAVLSKGTLRANGSSVELKDKMGGGYRIHVQKTETLRDGPEVDGVIKKNMFDVISYIAPSSGLAAQVIRTLEAEGIREYRFSGPTIEDVFLQLAEEIKDETSSDSTSDVSTPAATVHEKSATMTTAEQQVLAKDGLELMSGRRIGVMKQAWVLFLKRCTVFKHNWFPYFAAFVIPVAAAGLVTIFVKNQKPLGCDPNEAEGREKISLFNARNNSFSLVVGPIARLTDPARILQLLQQSLPTQDVGGGVSSGTGNSTFLQDLLRNITQVNTYDEFRNAIVANRKFINPAGFWLGDSSSAPLVAYKADFIDHINAFYGQNLMDIILANTPIAATFAPFDVPWSPDAGQSLQLLIYLCLALSAYPGFFALYPNLERRRYVRGLEYSNGVRAFPLWLAYVAFDFAIVVVGAAISVILFAAMSKVWYHVEYLFLIFILYGLASIQLAYLISLFCKNQLSAYAFTAAGQASMFLIYLIAYMATLTFAPVNKVDSSLLVVHFVIAAVAPIGSVMRTMFLALNLFNASCEGNRLSPNPGGILQYGGPILYLILQSVLLFLLLLWIDSGSARTFWDNAFAFMRRRKRTPEDAAVSDDEVANELTRVTTSMTGGADETDGLRTLNLTKTFGKNTAVDNVTFGVRHSEVFALLGPNGAGKSTTISMIRGDIRPNDGDVLVEQHSITKQLHKARTHLGVCPQFDAVDIMTVREHLRFYARVRGIPDIEHNVKNILNAVGLNAFRDRQAHALSGGNKRKLSLGIALMGNPSVVLLDEPSSGLDAAAKRIMWRTLAAVVPGRSILLTTHSMEEADALARRAGILARRMLAIGTTEQLRARFGDRLYVHLVCRGAPHTSEADIARIRDWILSEFPGAEIEDKTYHGQMRFSLPAKEVPQLDNSSNHAREAAAPEANEITPVGQRATPASSGSQNSAVGRLVVTLEEQKTRLGIEHYSVSPTTLDQVFLTIVGRHNVQEEGYKEEVKKPWWKRGW